MLYFPGITLFKTHFGLCFDGSTKIKKSMMKKSRFIIVVILFCFCLSFDIKADNGDLTNFKFVAERVKDSLSGHWDLSGNLNLLRHGSDEYADLLEVVSSGDSENEIHIERVKVMIVYLPFRKFPFFKQKWIRKVYFKAWIWKKGDADKQMVNWIFEDRIKKDPSSLENATWAWCIGDKVDDKEEIIPGFIEPVLAISASLVIIVSLFYIRS